MLLYAISMLEQLSNVFIEPIGPDGRLRVLNAMLRERGVEEMPRICAQTGSPTRAAEEYYQCLQTLIKHAKRSLDDGKTADIVPEEFRIIEVVMDKGGASDADGTA